MSEFWSLVDNETGWVGRCYWRTRNHSIMLIKVLRFAMRYHKEGTHLAYAWFLREIIYVQHHEFLHLFFKFNLKKWGNSEKRIHFSCEKITHELIDILGQGYWDAFYDVEDWVVEKFH
jgi:hypothetical protein